MSLRREAALDGSWARYHFKFLGLDDPILVSYRETFERKTQAIPALYEAVLREEDTNEV